MRIGFTLLEVLICTLIIGIISLLAVPNILSQIKEFELEQDVSTVKQLIKESRSIAITRSRTIYIDFSQANINHSENGGLIQIKQNDGTVISQSYLSYNILYNTSTSTIQNQKIIFNFQGQPVDSTGSISGFTTSNNKITIGAYKNNNLVSSRSMSVTKIGETID